jgi:hypothetical protein
MRALLLSGVLYLAGITITLYFRPALMFHPDGRWKEFGTISNEHTLFPFWLFCILWAILSYVCVAILIGDDSGAEKVVTVGAVAGMGLLKESEPPEDLVSPLPIKTKKKKNSAIHTEYGDMKPGYYMLNRKGSKEAGVPKYIYVGTDAVSDVGSESGEE